MPLPKLRIFRAKVNILPIRIQLLNLNNIKENEEVYLLLKIGLNKHDISILKKNIIKIINKLNNKSTISIDIDPIN